MKKERNSNIELLRIIAMVMIIAHHLGMHSGFDVTGAMTLNKSWIIFLREGGKVGVDLFILITGYFQVTSSGWRIKSLMKLYLEMSLAYLLASFICYCFGSLTLTSYNLVQTLAGVFFPVGRNDWWFATVYMVLSLISPYLNIVLTNLNKENYRKMLAVFSFIWCIVQTFILLDYSFTNLSWFCLLYAIGGYIRLFFQQDNQLSFSTLQVLSVLSYLLNFAVVLSLIWLGNYVPFLTGVASHFYQQNSLFVLMSSILIFLLFLSMDSIQSRQINRISKMTFGIYLVHDAVNIRSLLWSRLGLNAYINSIYLIPISIAVIFLIFIVGSLLAFLINTGASFILNNVIRLKKDIIRE